MPRVIATVSQSGPTGDAMERVLERWGGWIVAGFVHLALLAIFSNQFVVIQQMLRPKEKLVVKFTLPQLPPPPPVEPEPQVVPAMFSPAAATHAVREQEDIPEHEASAEAARDLPKEETVLAQDRASMNLESAARALVPEEVRDQIEKELQELKRRQAEQEVARAELQVEVRKLEVEAKGKEFTLDSDGGRQGAIRTLDVAGTPPDVVNRVFSRYHIRIERRQPASPSTPSFLNAAVTGEGTFRNVPASGVQDVFILTPTAIAMMSALESQALTERGFDPRTTRVREIRFGIVKNRTDEWDLGVTKLVTERIE